MSTVLPLIKGKPNNAQLFENKIRTMSYFRVYCLLEKNGQTTERATQLATNDTTHDLVLNIDTNVFKHE